MTKDKPTVIAAGRLGRFSAAQLRAELRRRELKLGRLRRRHQRLLSAVGALERQIHEQGGSLAGLRSGRRLGVRSRPRNEQSLAAALVRLLTGRTMGVMEIVEEVQKAGYRTTSPNFRTIVNQVLLNKRLFQRKGRGQYTAK